MACRNYDYNSPRNGSAELSPSIQSQTPNLRMWPEASQNIETSFRAPEKKTSTSRSYRPSIASPSVAMAPLIHASRICLRGLSRSNVFSTPVRALSTTTARNDNAASYSSPFKGDSKASQVPDWSKYLSKNSADNNKLFSYFMVGAMGALTAAGAKSAVHGSL